MKISIIGCGYVGKAIAKAWKDKGCSIRTGTRKRERVSELAGIADQVLLFPSGLSLTTLSEMIEGVDCVLFSAAADGVADYEDTYLRTAELISLAVGHHPRIKQILYTSSTSVYGEWGGDWVDEDSPLKAVNPEARILADTEQVLLNMQSGNLQVCIFRLGEIVGPGRETESRLRNAQGRKFPGTGMNYTNMSCIEDIVRALDHALVNKLDGIYNLCGDLHATRKELYDELCREHGLPKLEWDPLLSTPHSGNKRVSNAKIKSAGFVFGAGGRKRG